MQTSVQIRVDAFSGSDNVRSLKCEYFELLVLENPDIFHDGNRI